MIELTPARRRELRARAHHLHPVVRIGEAGLTPSVVKEIDASLNSHELIKIKVLGEDRRERERLIAEICRGLGAGIVQHIGRMLVIYRPAPQEDRPQRVRPPRRKKTRRTKRSYQMR